MEKRNYWTPDEIDILKREYGEMGTFIPILRQRHTMGSIKGKMYELRHPSYAKRRIIGKRRRNKEFEMSDSCQQIMDGIVLGDGYIQVIKGRNTGRLVLNQTRKHAQWLMEIQDTFEKNGIDSKLYEYKTKLDGNFFLGTRLETGFYINLKRERDRWYQGVEKNIPGDISLSPVMLAHWYMGDGCLESKKKAGKTYYRIRIYTNSFEMGNVKLFLSKLKEGYGYDFRTETRNRNIKQPITVLSSTKEVKSFLELISPYKVSCFDYKWRAIDKSLFKTQNNI